MILFRLTFLRVFNATMAWLIRSSISAYVSDIVVDGGGVEKVLDQKFHVLGSEIVAGSVIV